MTIAEADLDRLLAQAATKPASRPEFYDAFLEAGIYLIGQPTDEGTGTPGPGTFTAGDSLALMTCEDAEGEPYLPIFTSHEQMEQFVPPGTPYLSLRARDALELTRGSRLILNPAGQYAKEFLPQEIDDLLQTGAPHALEHREVPENTNVLLGQPNEYPHAMVEALSELLAKKKKVLRAYLALMHDQARDPEPTLLIGIEAEGSIDELMRSIGNVAGSTAPENKPVDVTRVQPGEPGVSAYLIAETTPFYERRKRTLFSSLFGAGQA